VTALPIAAPRIAPIPPGGRGGVWRWVAAAGAAGVLALILTFVAVRPRLPAQVPSHYGAAGGVTATMPPLEFLATAVAIQVASTLVLTVVIYLAFRSGVIEHQHGPGFAPALGGALAALALATAAPTTLLLIADAGYLHDGGVLALLVGLVVVVLPLGILVAVVGARGRGRVTRGGEDRFECSSCGATFLAGTARWVLGPHLGASVYLRCSHCGERGWDRRVGAPYFPGAVPGDEARRSG
jgi:hypothetical protein